MSAKNARGKLIESEIERCREEANWKRILELEDQIKASKHISEALSNFIIGEAKLEKCLEDYPPGEGNTTASSKSGLAAAKDYLLKGAGDENKKVEVSLDAWLLLAKLEYATGNYDVALKNLKNAGLDQLTEKVLTTRSLRIVAESYAVEGLCMEKTSLPHNSKFQQVERDSKMLRCFELAGDLALLCLQEQDKLTTTSSTHSLQSTATSSSTGGSASPMPHSSEDKRMGIILETALQRAPILHIKTGSLDRAVSRYRSMLMAVESSATQHMRLTLARQLAEVLLRGWSDLCYTLPDRGESMKGSSNLRVIEGPWKPKKYSGSNLFLPSNLSEEIILLLQICEGMAVREAVLSQSPEFAALRSHAYDNATAVYDLLCIALGRRKQFQILLEVFERAMKFSFEASHVWQQFGLTLVCMKHYLRSVQILQEAHRLLPSQPQYCLLAARISFQHLARIDEGLKWTQKALTAIEESSTSSIHKILISRCYMFKGIGLTLKSQSTVRQAEVQAFRHQAFEAFTRAQQLDTGDHLIEYYLAFHYAQNRQIQEAIHHVKLALYLRQDHLPSLILLILLLSAQKEYEEAIQLADEAAEEYPEHLQLMFVKAALEEDMIGGEAKALVTARNMLRFWNSLYKDQMLCDGGDSQSQVQGNDSHSVFNMSDKDTVSLHAESLAASRVEAALSEVASSLSSYQHRPGPQQAWLIQIQIWLLIAHLYVKTEQFNEANQCIQEASLISPYSHHIMFIKGQLHEKKHEFHEARMCYESALAINPYHTRSLRHLGTVYHYLGSDRLAEKTLLDAIKIDPYDHMVWAGLGEVMASLGELQVSTKCLMTSLEMEARAPVIPFSSIPLCYE